jgi:GNAT superfamily N-acetyltransferase
MRNQLLRAFAGRAARKTLQPFGLLDLSVVYRFDLAAPIEEIHSRIPVQIGEADDADLRLIQKITGSPYHALDLLMARRTTGSKCLLARIDGEIVGFNWLALGVVYDEFYRIALDPADAYCMDAHTIERYRGQRIHGELLCRLLQVAREMGFRRAFTRVSAMNVASWKSHFRLGWKEVSMTYLFHPRFGVSPYNIVGPSIYPVTPMQDSPLL